MLSRTETRLLAGLHRRKERRSEGLFLAEGVRVVEELLSAGSVLRLVVVSSSLEDTERGKTLLRELERRGDVRRVPDRELTALAATESPQGVVVAAEIPEASLANRRPGERSVVLVLDAVQDPGNFGTLARTAAAFGVDWIASLPGTVDAWNPKTVRASAGALFRTPVVECEWPELAEWLGRNGFDVYGADAAGEPARPAAAGPRTALVVGNEGAGLDPQVASGVDALVSVPMRGDTESLNVAVAAGILLYLFTAGEPF